MMIENTTKTKKIYILENIFSCITTFELYSYDTLIANAEYDLNINKIEISCYGLFSITTRRHIHDFAEIITNCIGEKIFFEDFKNAVGRNEIIIKF